MIPEGSADRLDPGLLWLYVFGPGYGESTVLRVPGGEGGHRVVVDGCVAGGHTLPRQLLHRREARWSCVVLTHPQPT